MSITWEEPGAGGALKKAVTQVAALALLAVVGGVGGAGLAAWALGSDDAGSGTETAMTVRASALQDAPAPADKVELSPATGGAPARTLDIPDAVSVSNPAQLPDGTPDQAGGLLAPPQFAELAGAPAPVPLPEIPSFAVDADSTAALPAPDDPSAPVAVAETETEVAALEAQMLDAATTAPEISEVAVEPDPGQESVDEVAAVISAEAPAVSTGPKGEAVTPAKAVKYVNLRAGPDNDASVLSIIPAGADILAEDGCSHWCAVVHDGKAGYVYKSFIGR